MAFKIAQSETYTQSITVAIPGSKAKNVFEVEFKRLPQSEINALMEKIKAGEIQDAELCREIVVGWSGVSDESGELAFTEKNLDALLEVFPVPRSIIEGFFSGISGAKVKN